MFHPLKSGDGPSRRPTGQKTAPKRIVRSSSNVNKNDAKREKKDSVDEAKIQAFMDRETDYSGKINLLQGGGGGGDSPSGSNGARGSNANAARGSNAAAGGSTNGNAAEEAEANQQKISSQALGALLTSYFSERVAPAIHDTAIKKETFKEWRDYVVL
jgi:hypothetical protein